jgi:hypothetical protein
MFSRNVVLKIRFLAVLTSLSGVALSEDATGVEGKVVDKAEHAPIRNAYVLVHRNGGTDTSARTDGSGRYLIELSSNIYDVFISAEGFVPTVARLRFQKLA